MKHTRRTLLVGAALAAALLGAGCERAADGTAAGGKAAPAAKFNGVDITGAEYARKLDLSDVEGKPRRLDEFRGKVVVVFFGYAQCPDVCPITLAELAAAKQLLGPDGDKLQGIFVTVDPERDSAEVLKQYVERFDPSFVALRGNLEQTKDTAREFKVYFAKVPGSNADSYTVDHTAGSYVFDPQGRVRLFVRYGSGAKALADDAKLLLAAGGA